MGAAAPLSTTFAASDSGLVLQLRTGFQEAKFTIDESRFSVRPAVVLNEDDG